MDKVWCIFSVSGYKGGELNACTNMGTTDMLDHLTDDWFFLNGKEDENLSDEELWLEWNKWYNHNDRHQLYAGCDANSETKVYSIKNGKLVRDFPTKEEIIERMKFIIEEWK